MPWAWLIRQVVRKKGGFHGTLGTMAKSATVLGAYHIGHLAALCMSGLYEPEVTEKCHGAS